MSESDEPQQQSTTAPQPLSPQHNSSERESAIERSCWEEREGIGQELSFLLRRLLLSDVAVCCYSIEPQQLCGCVCVSYCSWLRIILRSHTHTHTHTCTHKQTHTHKYKMIVHDSAFK